MDRQQLREDLIRDEGWREFVYDDATGLPLVRGSTAQGFPSVGYGFCISADRGSPLPKIIADIWLDHLIAEKLNLLRSRWPAFDSQPEAGQRALGSMAYQLGVSGLLRFRLMLSALEKGDREEAARQALDSLWAKQTPARAERIAALIRGGV